MDDLLKRIKASIGNRDGDPWFPELTADLAARAWASLHRDIGLTPDSYSTERVLFSDIFAPRTVVAVLKTCQSTSIKAKAISIEVLSQESAAEYQKTGVSFYSTDEILDTTVLSCIEDALATINQVPSLMRTVAALVRSLHVIRPKNEEHDVSFSEPHIPFSIFVSIPEGRIANDAVRVAEAIVHEGMHLQLTLIERVIPLIASMSKRYYSPWKHELRNAQGILHAIYVFGIINRFLQELAPQRKPGERKHIYERVTEIKKQLGQSQRLHVPSELTVDGCQFVDKLFQSSPSIRNSHFRSALR